MSPSHVRGPIVQPASSHAMSRPACAPGRGLPFSARCALSLLTVRNGPRQKGGVERRGKCFILGKARWETGEGRVPRARGH